MMMLILSLVISFSSANSDRAYIKESCVKALKKNINVAEICQCYDMNLGQRLTPEFFKILAKDRKGQSVEKELNSVEGATVIFSFEEGVLLKCKKDPSYNVGPEKRD